MSDTNTLSAETRTGEIARILADGLIRLEKKKSAGEPLQAGLGGQTKRVTSSLKSR